MADALEILERLYGPVTPRSRAGLMPETGEIRNRPNPLDRESAAGTVLDLGKDVLLQPVRAGEAVGEAMLDPTLGNITNAGAQTALTLGQPAKALGIGALGLGKAVADDLGVFGAEANAAKKRGAPEITPAPKIPGYTDEQQAVFNTAWEKTQRGSFMSGVDRRAAERAVQDGLDFMAKNAERKAVADQAEYNRKVSRAEDVRDVELGRQRRFADTETGKWYEENATWLPFATAFGGGMASRIATGPGKSVAGKLMNKYVLPVFTGGSLSYGAQNAPEIYEFSLPPAVNPEKEAFSKYAFELPEGHPEKENAADYAAGLPAINPVKSAAVQSFRENAPARLTAAGLEGISLGKLGAGVAGLPGRLVNDAKAGIARSSSSRAPAAALEAELPPPQIQSSRPNIDPGHTPRSGSPLAESRTAVEQPLATGDVPSSVSDLPAVVIIRSPGGTHHMGDSGKFASKSLYSRPKAKAKESKAKSEAQPKGSAPKAEKAPAASTAEGYLSDPDKLTRGMWTGGRVNAEPSQAQKEAGNYKKDHIRFQGLDISIENPKGGTRSGVDKGGKRWSVKMPAAYGYFKRTEGKDGDHVDCYVGPDREASRAFVVDQVDASSGKFDEHKVMLGYATKADALSDYRKAFSDGRADDRIGGVSDLSVDALKTWLRSGNTKAPLARQKYASGGRVDEPVHSGPLHSTVAGRTDHLMISVPAGAYVIPADIVSSLGEGNTNAGMEVVEQMFPRLPQKLSYAKGGKVPIAAAGGEFVLAPEQVAEIGGGDLDLGHAILDDWVKQQRAHTIDTLSNLPGPTR